MLIQKYRLIRLLKQFYYTNLDTSPFKLCFNNSFQSLEYMRTIHHSFQQLVEDI